MKKDASKNLVPQNNGGHSGYDPMELAAMLWAPYRAIVALSTPRLSTAERGRGGAVMAIPGLGTNDDAMLAFRTMLKRAGYQPSGWELGLNRGFDLADLDHLTQRVKEQARKDGAPVSLIGWSLGGIYARAIAQEAPGAVAGVITLGTPWKGVQHTSVAARHQARTGQHISEALPKDVWKRLEKTTRPLEVPYTSLYSKDDGVVDWQACVVSLDEKRKAQSIEVTGQHFGLPYNLVVFAVVEEVLADNRAEKWRPRPYADGANLKLPPIKTNEEALGGQAPTMRM